MTSISLNFDIEDCDIDAIFVEAEPDVNIPEHWDIQKVVYKGVNVLALLDSEDLYYINEYLNR